MHRWTEAPKELPPDSLGFRHWLDSGNLPGIQDDEVLAELSFRCALKLSTLPGN